VILVFVFSQTSQFETSSTLVHVGPKAAKVTARAAAALPKSLNLRYLIIMSGSCPSESDRCIENFMKQQHFLQLQATVNLLC
jgi:hypothetical protein